MGPVERIARAALEGGREGDKDAAFNPLPRSEWGRGQIVDTLVRGLRVMGYAWGNLAGGLSAAGVNPEEWFPEVFRLIDAEERGIQFPTIVSGVLGINEEFAESIRRELPPDLLQIVAEHLVASNQETRARWRKKLLGLD